MKKSRFTEDHWRSERALGGDLDGSAVPKHGISDATFNYWRSRYGVTLPRWLNPV